MIQRIQTLYLLLIFLGMLLLAFLPMATMMSGPEEFRITLWGIVNTDTGETVVPTPQMGILWTLATLLPLVTIFLFRHRWVQLRLCVVEIILLSGMQIYIAFYVLRSRNALDLLELGSIKYSPVDVIPLIGIILAILAFRGIVRDQALLNSLNRIR